MVIVVALLFCSLSSSAFTLHELESEGWTKVTELTDVDNFYYVLVDAGSSNYMVGRKTSDGDRAVYENMADPLGFRGVVWYLTASDNYFTMRSLLDDKYFISGQAGWNNSMTVQQWEDQGLFSFNYSLADGKYSLQSKKTNQYVGPWNDDGKVANNYENIACNKSAARAPGFYIYAISRTLYNKKAVTDSFLTNNGWTKVETNTALGNVDNYYLVIDAASFGFAMSRTNSGRPTFKSLSNPFDSKVHLWYTAVNGDGFNFQSAFDETYFTCAAGDWNSSMGTSPSAEIRATFADGKYTLSAGGSNNVGHWADTAEFPFETENIAGNKNDTNRNSFYIYAISKAEYATRKRAYYQQLIQGEPFPVNLAQAVTNNSDFSIFAKKGWTIEGTYGNQQTKNGTFESWNSSNVVVSQQLSDLPNGVYTVAADVISGNDTKEAYVYAQVGATEYKSDVVDAVASAGNYDTMSNEVQGKTLETEFAEVTDGTLTLGLKVPNGWVVFDNFSLLYYGNPISYGALPLPESGEMMADQWYYFDVTTAAANYNATATTLDAIVYSTDPNEQKTTELTTKFTATNNALEATRYYVKSTSYNNLEISVASFTYDVGAATASVAAGEYVQPGMEVTVTFAMSTNDPEPIVVTNFDDITFAEQTVTATPTTNGFTFVVPEVEAGSTANLVIPANAIGYNAGEGVYNVEQTIGFNTPVLFDGVYYFRNTDSNYEAKYIARGGSWATQAVMDDFGLATYVKTSVSNETTIQFYDNEYWLSDDGFCYTDGGTDRMRRFTVVKAENGYKFLNKNNNKYLAIFKGAVVADAVEGGNLEGTTNIWALETTAQYIPTYTRNANKQAVAAASNIEGLSTVTTKAELETAIVDYKTVEVEVDEHKESQINKYAANNAAGTPHTYFEETVENLRPGLYKLTCNAMQRGASYRRVNQAEGARGLLYLYANDARTQIVSCMEQGAETAYESDFVGSDGKHYPNNSTSTYTAFDNGLYVNDVFVYVTPDEGKATGTLKFGVKNPSRLGGNFDTYVVYANFKLMRYFDMQSIVLQAEGVEEGTVPTAAYQYLQQTLADNNKTFDTDEEYVTACDNIEKALADVLPLQVPYAAWKEVKTYADENVAADNDNVEGHNIFDSVITAQTEAVEAVEKETSVETITNATTELLDAMNKYVSITNPVGEDEKFNLTYLLTNPDLTGLPTWSPCDGWAGDNDGNSQVMSNDDVAGVDNKPYFYEFWNRNPYTSGFNLYLTATLPAGTYNMECYAFAQCAGNTSTAGQTPAPQGISFSVNDTDGSYITSTDMASASLEFVNDSEQTVKIGLKAHEGNNRTWMGIGYVKLYKIPAKAFVIDCSAAYDYSQSGAGEVEIKNRPIKVGYNTVVFPFSMTSSEVETIFGADSKVSILGSYDAENKHLKFVTQSEGILPNRPCLVKATESRDPSESFNLKDRTLVSLENALPTYNIEGAFMTGTYEQKTNLPANSWFVQDGALKYAADDTSCWVNSTRAYITLEGWEPDPSGVKALTITFDDEEATAIATLENGDLNIRTGKAYDLSGREVKNPTKGLYIIDGKKVFLK